MAIPSCDPLYLSRGRGATAGGVPFTLSSGPPPPSPPSDISRASRAAARCASPPRVSTARGIARHHHHHHHPRSGWRRARRRSRSRASTTARRGQSASAVAFSGLSIRARKRGGESKRRGGGRRSWGRDLAPRTLLARAPRIRGHEQNRHRRPFLPPPAARAAPQAREGGGSFRSTPRAVP